MSNLTVTKRIEAPQQTVFEVASDLERGADHLTGIERIELLTPGPVGKGTRWRETRIMFGKEATEELEMTDIDAPNFYTAGGESCGSAFSFTLHFHPDDNATNVEANMQCRPITLFAKLMSPLSIFMIGSMRKCIEQDLEDLKQVAESRATSS